MTTQAFSVPAMHCPSCTMLLEGLEDQLEGIKSVKTDFRKRQMEVEFDEARVSVGQIVEAAREEGYEATPHSP